VGVLARDELLTVPDVADRLKVSTQTIYRWIEERALEAVQIGKQYRVRSSELERIVEGGLVRGGDEWTAEAPSRPDLEP